MDPVIILAKGFYWFCLLLGGSIAFAVVLGAILFVTLIVIINKDLHKIDKED